MPKYTKKHCEAIGARIMEYDEAIALGATHIRSCDLCFSAFPGGEEKEDIPCHKRCLIGTKKLDCDSDGIPPRTCKNAGGLAKRRAFLLSQIEKNGYEIVEVDA